MSNNFTTIKSISDNVRSVLQAQGIKFSHATYDEEKNIPLALFPYGEIFYKGEDFEHTNGQQSGYAVANFDIKVITQDRSNIELVKSVQKWIHAVRDALTVNALNIVDLSSSKLVSLVEFDSAAVIYNAEYATINHTVKIRYRET